MDATPKALSLAQADTALPQVVPVLEQLQRLQRALLESEQQREELTHKLSVGNGHSHAVLQDQLHAGIARHDQLVAEAEAAFDQLDERGAMLKDLDSGLIDFYGERDGELILLCWRLGEAPRIRYWHTLDGGFAGRQPVDALIR